MSDVTISVKDVTKIYKLYDKPTDRIKEALFKKNLHKDFYAVNNVSFDVRKGETVGIIGKNGSGKSTLLKMVTGVLTPSQGEISLAGPVSALLELGTGFDGEQDGISNIYLNGNMVGLTKEEIDASLQDIIDFADIGDFIYQPVKTYSSGMFVRLAFAVAINIKPEILIVDEALSVGDFRFQQKCYRKIREFKEKGTVLFVSHDTGAITSFCDRVIWLDDGKIYKEGKPEEIIEEYLAYMRYDVKEMQNFVQETKTSDVEKISSNIENGDEATEEDITETESEKKITEEQNAEEVPVEEQNIEEGRALSFGNGHGKFTKVELLNEDNEPVSIVKSGMKLVINMDVTVNEDIDMPILGINLKDAVGNVLIVTNTVFEKNNMQKLKAGEKYNYKWKFTFPLLRTGKYSLDVALAEGTYQVHEQVHFINDVLVVNCVDERLYQEGRGQLIPDDFELEETKIC